MDHGLELIQSYPGNRWNFDFYDFLISWKYWKSGMCVRAGATFSQDAGLVC